MRKTDIIFISIIIILVAGLAFLLGKNANNNASNRQLSGSQVAVSTENTNQANEEQTVGASQDQNDSKTSAGENMGPAEQGQGQDNPSEQSPEDNPDKGDGGGASGGAVVGDISNPDDGSTPTNIGDIAAPQDPDPSIKPLVPKILKKEGESCTQNNDCVPDLYCYKEYKADGSACNENTEGVCAKKPYYCGWPLKTNPVCGCDNKTYTNGCYAQQAEVNIFSIGAC